MKDSQNFLFIIHGPAAKCDVLEHFTKQLEERSFSILQMHYLNCQSALFLWKRFEISDFIDKNSLWKDFGQSGKNISA